MVNELIVEVITYAVTSIVSLLIGVLISERFKKWWRRRERLHDLLEPKIKFRVTHISDPEAPAIDFSPKLKEQNRQQNTFLFEFEDFMRGPTLDAFLLVREAECGKGSRINLLTNDLRDEETWC